MGATGLVETTRTTSGGILRLFVGEVRHHALLLVMVAAYGTVVLSVLWSYGLPWDITALHLFVVTALWPTVIVFFRAFGEIMRHAIHVRPFRVRGVLLDLWNSEIFSARYVAAAFIPVLLLPMFSSFFASFKQGISVFVPFYMDKPLMQLDQFLHFGVHPWEWIHPFLSFPVVTAFISYLYNFWFGLMWFVIYWFVVSLKDRSRRMRVLVTFCLLWAVIGTGMAAMLSSAGPCYYSAFVDGPNPYEPLMAYLRAAHETAYNWSILAQNYLWEGFTTQEARSGGGISAMPSMHVAVATLWVLIGWPRGVVVRALAVFYLVVIVVGSVHLGWHYALDGYVGALGAVAMWSLAGVLVRRFVPAAPDCDAVRTGDLLGGRGMIGGH